jgi:hypothetical protein
MVIYRFRHRLPGMKLVATGGEILKGLFGNVQLTLWQGPTPNIRQPKRLFGNVNTQAN